VLFRKEYGKRKNPTLIFLHGFLGSHKDFNSLIYNLKDYFFCVALDLPGHGESKDNHFTDYPSFESSLLETLSFYQEKTFSIVGYSMGGRLAVQVASKVQPSSLILISSAIEPLTLEEKEKREIWELKQIEALKKDSFSNFLDNWYSLPIFKTLKKNAPLYVEMIQNRSKENPNTLAKVMQVTSPNSLETPTLFLSHYSKPLLYLSGKHDLKYQEQAINIKTRFKQAWTHSEQNASHAVHLEAPKSISNQIKNFHRYYHGRMDTKTDI